MQKSLKNQMIDVVEETPEDTLPFEISDSTTAEDTVREVEEEKAEEKKDKKKTDKQVSLFSF